MNSRLQIRASLVNVVLPKTALCVQQDMTGKLKDANEWKLGVTYLLRLANADIASHSHNYMS